MTRKKETPVEIVVIADRSGSMASVREEAIGGFNNFLAEQQALPGKATLTLVLFDDKYEVPVQNLDIQDVQPLTYDTFVPRGMTATYDAVGKAITELLQRAPTKAIVLIITDGGENASKEYTSHTVQQKVKEAEAKGYEVLFLAQNLDARQAGAALGLQANSTVNLVAGAKGMTQAYETMGVTTRSYRS